MQGYLAMAVEAAWQAGGRILDVYGTDFSVTRKADDSPLTLADRSAHRVICDLLHGSRLPILSEEGRPIAYAVRKQWERFWMVDPLDGTKEFVRRNGEFTVNIALVEACCPVLGVIYVPVTDTLYYAAPGMGAFKRANLAAAGKACRAGSTPRPALDWDAVVAEAMPLPMSGRGARPFTVVVSRSHAAPPLADYLAALAADHPDMDRVSAGSSLKFCRVAEGMADQYPRLGPTMEWDTAAGQAIVACAGGRVVAHGSGVPLQYNKPDLHNPWFVATGRG